MRRLTAMFAIACLASPALAGAAGKPSTNPMPDVRIDGDTLIYIGGTNDNGLQALKAVLAKVQDGQITKMLVNSGGGDTKAAIQIGFIIADLKPHLTIDTGCFSSCANFIAPAAATIAIRENAFLGWHGNDRGFAITAAEEGVTLREHLRAMVAPQASDAVGPDGRPVDIEAFLDEAVTAAEARMTEEAALYARIGLPNDTFAVCGVGSRFDNRLSGDQRGWGFSLDDMARLGLPPVRYEGAGRYEDSPAFRRWLIVLTPEDCRG
jgi:hypothetical protein